MDQAPWDSVSVCPAVVVPEIDGGDVLEGAPGNTTAVGMELTAAADPPAFVAASCTRIVYPTSAAVSVYDGPVAPEIAEHAFPELSQSSHW